MSTPASSNPAEAPWTVARILEWTTQHLKKSGCDTPRLDAELLLAEARRCPRIQLYVQFAELVTDAQRVLMRDLVKRRTQAEPVAYLIGRREFFGLEFLVNRNCLVPRPDTETLVLELVTNARRLGSCRVLDVGTGSGCIAVATAVSVEPCHVTAVDISEEALSVARDNAAKHQVASRIEFIHGDLLSTLPSDAMFDFIASNPPYIADGEIAQLPPDVRQHEPHLALQGGVDGLDIIRRLLQQVPQHLKPGGQLLIEFSPEQMGTITELTAAISCLSQIRVLKDLAGRARVISAVRSS